MSPLTELKDEELLALSVGNPGAFGVLYDRHEPALRRKVRHMMGDREEVEDILQDTFTKIYLNANKFKKVEGASFKSWMYKILINVTFTQYKKLHKTDANVDILDDELREVIPDTSIPDLKTLEMRDYVASVLTAIPDKMADALTAHFIHDKPEAQIAEEQGLTLGAVKTRIHRAKQAFRDASKKLE